MNTETDIWRWLRDKLPGYSVRLENAISSGISDVLWCPLGLAVFLELKIRKGKYIHIKNSQMVFGIHVAKSVPPNQHMFVVGNLANPALTCYNFTTIEPCPTKIVDQWTVKVDVSNVVVDQHWAGEKDVRDYVELLQKAKRNG